MQGKEFKGTAFISKPERILFEDFEVGVPHTQTILVTNVSFSFNSFKLLPLADSVKDFFHIVFTPTGRMSAGLSTTIQITFTPQVNKDINEVFPILAETGPINIPLLCTCKKALLSVDSPLIDFGNVIFQEKLTRSLKVKNSGALPTSIYVKTADSRSIPFVTQADLQKKEQEWRYRRERESQERAREHQKQKDERKQA